MPRPTDRTLKPPLLRASAAFLVLAAFLPPVAARGQSFDCQKAYYVDEKTICQDSGLGQLDRQLASVYGRWVGRLPRDVRDQLQANETMFVQARRRCGQNRQCIEQSYRNRIEEIQETMREESPNRRERAGNSGPHRRPEDVSSARPERDLRSSAQPSGGVAAVAQPAEREPDGSPSGPAPESFNAEPARPTAAAVANTPTRAEASEALRSAEREEPVETKASKRHDRKARAHTGPAALAEREPSSSRSKGDYAKPEQAPDDTRATAAPQPKRGVPKNAPAVAAGAPAPAPQGSAPAEAKPSSGPSAPQIQWVNPPPASGK